MFNIHEPIAHHCFHTRNSSPVARMPTPRPVHISHPVPTNDIRSGLIGHAIAASRSRNSWNERFGHWERPASTTEENQIQRSANMVQQALNNNPWLVQHDVRVVPQGSYHNNTNVRQESDMDLCALHPTIHLSFDPGIPVQEACQRLRYTFIQGPSILELAQNLRHLVGFALYSAFGHQNVQPGNKAFRVSAVPDSRADADVVPALRHHHVFRQGSGLLSVINYNEGVIIFPPNGTPIVNFPRQHHENGKAKRLRTAHRFKKVVRIAKRLRDDLVSAGLLDSRRVPSFLIESLIYNVEDFYFLVDEDRYDRMCRVLRRTSELLANPFWTANALEINGLKSLFSPTQPWTVAHAQEFVSAALRRLEP